MLIFAWLSKHVGKIFAYSFDLPSFKWRSKFGEKNQIDEANQHSRREFPSSQKTLLHNITVASKDAADRLNFSHAKPGPENKTVSLTSLRQKSNLPHTFLDKKVVTGQARFGVQ